MTDRSDPRLVNRLRALTAATALFSAGIGLSALAGWLFHIPSLTTWGAAPVTMVANTAACFVLVGVSLWLLRERNSQSFAGIRKLAGRAAASIVAMAGLLSLAEHLFGLDFGVDQLLLTAPPSLQTAATRPGLMSPITAGAFLLLGFALLAIDWKLWRRSRPAEFLALAAGGAAAFGLLTFAFDPHIYAAHLSLALPTGVTLAIFSLGLICARTESGLGALLCSRRLGGMLARRLLPAAFVPVLVGWFRWRITAAGIYSEWGVVVWASLISMSLLGGLIIWAAAAVDRSEAEQVKVEEGRERLAAIVESSDDAIISKTLDGTITAWNRGAEKVFGYSSAEAVGKSTQMLFPPERANEEADILMRIGRGESIEHFETVRVRKDGTHIDVSVTISPIRNSNGVIMGASKIARDVSERKRAEEALCQSDARRKFALETAKLGDWELNLTTLVATRSLLHDQIFGYESLLPEWNFDIFLRHVHPEDRKRVREHFQSCASQGRGWEFECRIVCPNGDIRSIWACGDHYRDSLSGTTRMSGIVQDITSRKHAEAELARSNRELEQFAYVASHDLQEPLRMVASYTQLLSDRYSGKLDENANKFLGYAREGAVRMQVLIQDLLSFSRVVRDGATRKSVDCNVALDEALQSLTSAIEESGAVVTHATLPTVWADQTQVAQVFQNLIGNAIKFHNGAPPECSVQVEKSGHEWLFSVSDNGIGIAPEYTESIFVVFQRLHARTEYPGNGIGLAICKKIIEHYGGTIWVKSKVGQGSSFKFTLPAAAPEEEGRARS
jgi:PAS domain S-box-containing protein